MIQEKKLVRFGKLKFFLFSLLFSFLLGVIFGITFFILTYIQINLINFKAPLFSLILLSFILIPLVFALIGAILGFLIVLALNLILRIIRGVNVYFKEEDFSLPVLNVSVPPSQGEELVRFLI